MWSRMVKLPELVETVARESTPDNVNVTDQGFPEEVPAFRDWLQHSEDVVFGSSRRATPTERATLAFSSIAHN